MKRILVALGSFLLGSLSIVIIVKIIDLINYECPFEKIFHIYCAGCGMTRMFKSIMDLNIYQAFRYNPLVFIYFILFLIYVLINSVRYVFGKEYFRLNFKVIIVLVTILIIYMFIRNIPIFSYLKPTKI